MQNKNSENPDPFARVKQVAFGYIQSQCLYTAIKLGVPDLLSKGRQTADSMASKLDTNSETLARLIDTLIQLGIFTQDKEGYYSHNVASECLSSSHENSLADLILFCGRESYHTFGHLEEAVRDNTGVFEKAWNKPFWEHLQSNKERAIIFGRAMERQSEKMLDVLVNNFDFSQYHHIADIGGGKGQFFRPLAKSANFNFKGTVFDLPAMQKLATDFIASEDLNMCQFTGGNFFESIPVDADLYILKFVIHDWDDENALKILKNIRNQMKKGSQLMLIELFRGAAPGPWSYLSDMLMLTTFGAKERSEQQYQDLLQQAGFKVVSSKAICDSHYYSLACPDETSAKL